MGRIWIRVRADGAWFRQPLPQHVRRGHARAVERLLAIGGGRAPHTSFHIGQARTARATGDVRARRADGQVFGLDRANLFHLAEKNSRYPRISAAEYFPWAAETARRERHRRRAKCSRRNGPRCTSNPQDPPPTAVWEGRRTLPGWRPAPDCGKLPASSSPGMRSARTEVSPSIMGVMVGSSV